MATFRWRSKSGDLMPHSFQLEEAADGVACQLTIVKQNTQEPRFTVPKPVTLRGIQVAWQLQQNNWNELAQSDETEERPFRAVRIIRIGTLGFIVWKVRHKKNVADDTCEFFPAGTDIELIVAEHMK